MDQLDEIPATGSRSGTLPKFEYRSKRRRKIKNWKITGLPSEYFSTCVWSVPAAEYFQNVGRRLWRSLLFPALYFFYQVYSSCWFVFPGLIGCRLFRPLQPWCNRDGSDWCWTFFLADSAADASFPDWRPDVLFTGIRMGLCNKNDSFFILNRTFLEADLTGFPRLAGRFGEINNPFQIWILKLF